MAKAKPEHMTIEKWFFILITAGVVYLFWQIIEPFILVLLVAGVTAIIVSPLETRLRKLVKNKHVSAAILSLAVFALAFVPLLITLFLMVSQASELVQAGIEDTAWLDQLNPATSPLIQALPEIIQQEIVAIDVAEIGKSVGTWVFENLGDVFASTTALVLNAFIYFICLYYLLVDRDRAYNEALALSPLDDKIDAKLLKRIVNTVRSVVFGVLVLAVIQGIFAGIGMTIFGVPGSLLWGALTVVAAMVPMVGTALVLVPAILFLFFSGSTGAAIGLTIWGIVFVGLSDNFIGPYLIGGATKMHNFLVLISVLGGLHAFGSVGGLAGPIILAALLALLELYKSGILTTGKIQKA
jgi:predicted PurR-regulated permease PerM